MTCVGRARSGRCWIRSRRTRKSRSDGVRGQGQVGYSRRPHLSEHYRDAHRKSVHLEGSPRSLGKRSNFVHLRGGPHDLVDC